MTVKQYQKLLQDKGYYFGAIDGLVGPLTRAAVEQFQQDRALSADSICGPLTQAELARTEDFDWSHYKYFKKSEFRCQCSSPENSNSAKNSSSASGGSVEHSSNFEQSDSSGNSDGSGPDGFCGGYPAPLAEQLVYILNSLRQHYGQPIYVTSGLRCPRHNANVGGVSGSRHKCGKAADITMGGLTDQLKSDIIARAYGLGARYAYTNDDGMAGAVHIDVQ